MDSNEDEDNPMPDLIPPHDNNTMDIDDDNKYQNPILKLPCLNRTTDNTEHVPASNNNNSVKKVKHTFTAPAKIRGSVLANVVSTNLNDLKTNVFVSIKNIRQLKLIIAIL